MEPTILQLSSPQETSELLATRIKELRLLEGWTQATLASRAGVSLPTLRRFERTGNTSVENLLKLFYALGRIDEFPEGETRLATFRNPNVMPTDGKTVDTACWVRRVAQREFQVFAINCAHLGCPVRWFPQSQLFMCPCHGGAYYADGSRASGPPERGLFTYDVKVVDGSLQINAGQMPTLSNTAKLVQIKNAGGSPCAG